MILKRNLLLQAYDVVWVTYKAGKKGEQFKLFSQDLKTQVKYCLGLLLEEKVYFEKIYNL